jgi:hypothetical protein
LKEWGKDLKFLEEDFPQFYNPRPCTDTTMAYLNSAISNTLAVPSLEPETR